MLHSNRNRDAIEMPRLSAENRERAIGRLQAGESTEHVARALGVHVSTIYRLWNRFQATASTADGPRTGRPRVTTPAQDRLIARQHRRDPWLPAAETARNTIGTTGGRLSNRTVRRRLRDAHLRCRRPCRRTILTPQHRHQRQQWAQAHVNWRNAQWRRVLFSDESRFCVDPANGRIRVWRMDRCRYNDENVLERDPWGGESVMIWGAMSLNQLVGPVIFQNIGPGRGNGVTAQRYIAQVLVPHVVPFFQRHPNFLFQQDNARPHTARATQGFLRQNNIHLMPHPARSPDLNPIEHLWDEIQRQLNQMQPRPRTAVQLGAAITRVFAGIGNVQINRLVNSMHRRCTAVIAARGGHTVY